MKPHTEAPTSSAASDYLSDATKFGSKQFVPSLSKYVCHTSSIPLASTANAAYIMKHTVSKTCAQFHGGSEDHVACPKRSCMYVDSQGVCRQCRVFEECPCRKVPIELTPICFMVYVKSLARNISPIENIEGSLGQRLNPKQIMFCYDGQNILDESYGAVLRSVAKCSGFSQIRHYSILPLMNTLYWFHKFGPKFKIEQEINRALEKRPFKQVVQAIKQSIHTLNGFILKKMFAFGPEIVSYRVLAEQTARTFRDLFVEYTMLEGERYPLYMPDGIFQDAKDFANHIKQTFHLPTIEGRMKTLQYNFKNKSLKSFFSTELNRLENLIANEAIKSRDYTDSLAWIFRNAEACQTRVLGYLPPILATKKAREFREKVSRPLEDCSTEEMNFVALGVMKNLERLGIPRNFLEGDDINSDRDDIREVLSNIKLDLTLSSSVDTKFSDAGKLEDARLLFRKIADNKWVIPIRDLDTFEILSFLPVIDNEDDESIDLSRYIFWTSLQVCLNFLAERGLEEEWVYYELPIGEDEYKVDVLDCAILHINEPGKLRDLVKSKSVLSWTLVPGAKVMQAVIAMLPAHTCGLQAAAHDWSHTLRCSSMSTEATFMYRASDQKLMHDIRQVFKDWQEATDFISKRMGIAHIKGLMAYIAFPRAYGSMILKLMREPQPSKECSMLSYMDGDDPIVINNNWTGFVNEGFMMGLQVTKVALHAIHLSEQSATFKFLESFGIHFDLPARYGRMRDIKPVLIPRDFEKKI